MKLELPLLPLLVLVACQGATPSSVAPLDDSGRAGSSENADTPRGVPVTPLAKDKAAREAAPAQNARSPEPTATVQRGVPRIDKIFPEAEATLACQSDAECAITCRRDGDCCPELCGCSQAMNRRALEKLTSHLEANCGPSPICPMATCEGLKRYRARCEQGLCTAHREPERR